DGGPSALEERQSTPDDDRRGEQKLDPRQPARGQGTLNGHSGQHVGHRDDQQRSGQRDADPETSRHVAQFRILYYVGGSGSGFEGHSANGATPGLGANDFRVHGAGVLNFAGERGRLGLKGHATLRAGAWMELTNFGTHGADVGLRHGGLTS